MVQQPTTIPVLDRVRKMFIYEDEEIEMPDVRHLLILVKCKM